MQATTMNNKYLCHTKTDHFVYRTRSLSLVVSLYVCGDCDTLWLFSPPLVGSCSSSQPLLLAISITLFTMTVSGEWLGLGEEEGEGAVSSSNQLVLEAFIKLVGVPGRSTTTCSYEKRRNGRKWRKEKEKSLSRYYESKKRREKVNEGD